LTDFCAIYQCFGSLKSEVREGMLYFDFKSVTYLHSCFHFNKEQ